ncbi:SDR family oxidoreductase [Streptomyces sp. M10(2022)]
MALVTGGSKGTGRAIARELAARGAHIVLNYFHSHDQAKQTRDELTAEGHRVDLVRASVARQEQVDRMFAETDRLHGRLDILVNSAADGALLPLDQITDEHLDRAIEINYKGGLRCARAAAPLMARGGGGSIITVSALGGSQMVMANYLACAPAKAAAEAASRYLAVELAPLGIRVNTASAAMLSSEVADKFPDAARMQDVIARATPSGRLGTPEEFATVVAFLASDDARWITGQVILADGGLTLGAALLSPPAAQHVGAGAVAAAEAPVSVDPPMPEVPLAEVEFGDDSIAVVGMGLAVAGANSPEEFWQLRMTGTSCSSRSPRTAGSTGASTPRIRRTRTRRTPNTACSSPASSPPTAPWTVWRAAPTSRSSPPSGSATASSRPSTAYTAAIPTTAPSWSATPRRQPAPGGGRGPRQHDQDDSWHRRRPGHVRRRAGRTARGHRRVAHPPLPARRPEPVSIPAAPGRRTRHAGHPAVVHRAAHGRHRVFLVALRHRHRGQGPADGQAGHRGVRRAFALAPRGTVLFPASGAVQERQGALAGRGGRRRDLRRRRGPGRAQAAEQGSGGR